MKKLRERIKSIIGFQMYPDLLEIRTDELIEAFEIYETKEKLPRRGWEMRGFALLLGIGSGSLITTLIFNLEIEGFNMLWSIITGGLVMAIIYKFKLKEKEKLILQLEKSNKETITILDHIIDTEQEMSEDGQHLLNEKIKELK